MIRHQYIVYGVYSLEGFLFTGACVSDDIMNAINLFREKGYSVWNIERGNQVKQDEPIGIQNISIINRDAETPNNISSLYNCLMKRDLDALDEIYTLDEAKQIIQMIIES